MPFVNVGAIDLSTGQRFKTKKALKAVLQAGPETVAFDSTSALGALAGKTFKGDDVPAGFKLSVVGPDPYTSRKWYATVERKVDGTVKVS